MTTSLSNQPLKNLDFPNNNQSSQLDTFSSSANWLIIGDFLSELKINAFKVLPHTAKFENGRLCKMFWNLICRVQGKYVPLAYDYMVAFLGSG